MMNLLMAPTNVELEIVKIKKGRNSNNSNGECCKENQNRHLANLGFVEGAKITVVTDGGNGNLIVKVKDSKVAIGRGLAKKIMVSGGC